MVQFRKIQNLIDEVLNSLTPIHTVLCLLNFEPCSMSRNITIQAHTIEDGFGYKCTCQREPKVKQTIYSETWDSNCKTESPMKMKLRNLLQTLVQHCLLQSTILTMLPIIFSTIRKKYHYQPCPNGLKCFDFGRNFPATWLWVVIYRDWTTTHYHVQTFIEEASYGQSCNWWNGSQMPCSMHVIVAKQNFSRFKRLTKYRVYLIPWLYPVTYNSSQCWLIHAKYTNHMKYLRAITVKTEYYTTDLLTKTPWSNTVTLHSKNHVWGDKCCIGLHQTLFAESPNSL